MTVTRALLSERFGSGPIPCDDMAASLQVGAGCGC
jgi:hypothetical protein